MDDFLIFLAEKDALQNPIQITTKSLGRAFSMSQQNASVRIRKLEEKGFLQKSAKGIKLTEKGKKELSSTYHRLKRVFMQKHYVFVGKVVRGLDEGRYFVSLPQYKKRINAAIGFIPWPGTLNVELDESQLELRVGLREHKPLVIDGFTHKGRDYGPVELYACNVNGYKGAIIFPFRSHHGLRVLELISPYDLSKKLETHLGSKLKVEVIFE